MTKDKTISRKLKKFNLKAFEVRNYFIIWKYLEDYKNTNEVGKRDAERNAELMSFHKGFFVPIMRSVTSSLIINFTKFFSNSKSDDFRIEPLVREVDERFNTYFKDRFGNLKENFRKVIEGVRRVRHELFAHQDIKKSEHAMPSIKEIEELINELVNLFNDMSSETSSGSWVHQKQNELKSHMDTDLLMENLRRGERMRKVEVNVRHSAPHYKKYF